MDPITLAIMGGSAAIGGIGQMLSGNNQASMAQAALQQQRYDADRQYQLQTAGQRDARGNVVRYVPGWGWVSEPTATTKSLLDAGDRENYLQVTQDAPLRREALNRNAQVGRELQSPLRDRIAALSGPRTDPKAFAGLVSQQAGNAVASSADENAANIGRIAARTGNTTSTGAALSRANDTRSRAVGDTVLEGLIKGRTAGENIRTSEDARLGNDVTRLISGQPATPSFAPIPEGPTGPQPRVGQGHDTGGANALAAKNLIPMAGANKFSGLAELGLLGGSIYDTLNKNKQQTSQPEWQKNWYNL